MKLVDKQYELLKKERSKPQDDSKEPPVANGTTEPTNNFPQQNGQPEVILSVFSYYRNLVCANFFHLIKFLIIHLFQMQSEAMDTTPAPNQPPNGTAVPRESTENPEVPPPQPQRSQPIPPPVATVAPPQSEIPGHPAPYNVPGTPPHGPPPSAHIPPGPPVSIPLFVKVKHFFFVKIDVYFN